MKISFAHDSPSPMAATASIVYFTTNNSYPELGSGTMQVMHNFYSDTAVSLETKEERQIVTIDPGKVTELDNVRLMTGSGRVTISLYKAGREILTSDEVTLPDWQSLPSEDQLYLLKKEGSNDVSGLKLAIPLHAP